jgi:hypothetical protein
MIRHCVSPDNKVGENAARPRISLFAPTFLHRLEKFFLPTPIPALATPNESRFQFPQKRTTRMLRFGRAPRSTRRTLERQRPAFRD